MAIDGFSDVRRDSIVCIYIYIRMCDTGFVIKFEETSCEDDNSVRRQYKVVSYINCHTYL